TTDDPQGRDIVTDLIKSACSERVYPVGRLDRDTTGLLLLTNDGELAKKLSHPSFNKKKIYQVGLDKVLKKEDLDKVREGFELEDGFIKVDSIEFISDDKRELGVELHSGRNRIVRRIFEHLGYRIKKLDRVYYVGLTKKDLPRGKWRFLNENEIAMLKMGSFR
ncbi:MAG TPA: pseudouridine synthase, partial [Bacteroidales bacterium]|nr:pseudouridine synthase [Bacteroidales bacterium]